LHRSGDAVDNVEAGRDLARRIPGATFVELPGDDWLARAGDQARLLEEVESFLKGIREEEVSFDRVLAIPTKRPRSLNRPPPVGPLPPSGTQAAIRLLQAPSAGAPSA